MLDLEIKGKVYSFKFGIGFLRQANAKYKQTNLQTMIPIESGLQVLVARIIDGHTDALVDVLLMANKGTGNTISKTTLEDYIDDEADVDALRDEVLDFLAGSAACRQITQAVLDAIRPTENPSTTTAE